MNTTIQLAINGVLMGGVYALISVGLTLSFGVMRIVNFAHGEFLMLAMFASFWSFHLLGVDPYVTALVVIPMFFILGVVVQRLIIQPILGVPAVVQIFATVGLSVLLQNLALLLWSGDYRSVVVPYSSADFRLGEISISAPRLFAFGVAVLLGAALLIFLKWTFMGKAMRAIVQNRDAAVLLGINVKRLYAIAFGIGIALVGVAGAILTPIYQVFPTVGLNFVLAAFVVVILGGLGSVVGAFTGGIIIGLVESFSGFYVAPDLKEAIYYVIFVLILLIRPSGMFGILGSEQLGGH